MIGGVPIDAAKRDNLSNPSSVCTLSPIIVLMDSGLGLGKAKPKEVRINWLKPL